MSRSSKYHASPHRPFGSSVFTYFAPGLCENGPHRLRSTRGPCSRYFSGSQVCHTCWRLDDVVVDADDLRELG